MPKAPYDPVKLNVTWSGEPCQVGDELVTRTGRRYMILKISGKSFYCMVLPKDEIVVSAQWNLTWNRYKSKRTKP